METNPQIPPLLNPPPSSAGRIGLGLSLVAPAMVAMLFLLHPG